MFFAISATSGIPGPKRFSSSSLSRTWIFLSNQSTREIVIVSMVIPNIPALSYLKRYFMAFVSIQLMVRRNDPMSHELAENANGTYDGMSGWSTIS